MLNRWGLVGIRPGGRWAIRGAARTGDRQARDHGGPDWTGPRRPGGSGFGDGDGQLCEHDDVAARAHLTCGCRHHELLPGSLDVGLRVSVVVTRGWRGGECGSLWAAGGASRTTRGAVGRQRAG